jgi:Arc/MetJ-type ribon-helix-helix transcriptional regulator
MHKTNLQIRISPEVDSQISKFAPKSKSDFVRKAVEEKIRRETHLRLEEQWIEALKKRPEDDKDAERWIKAEVWGDR